MSLFLFIYFILFFILSIYFYFYFFSFSRRICILQVYGVHHLQNRKGERERERERIFTSTQPRVVKVHTRVVNL